MMIRWFVTETARQSSVRAPPWGAHGCILKRGKRRHDAEGSVEWIKKLRIPGSTYLRIAIDVVDLGKIRSK
jgi:hypothetical protein